MSSRILVTGGAGFIGSTLTKKLLERGHSVVVLDNFYAGRIENFGEVKNHRDLQIVKGDVRDRRVLSKIVKDVDGVVHLAGLVDPVESIKNPSETHDVNVTGTLNMLESSVQNGVKRFVFASSAAVYGDGNPLPLKEEYSLRPMTPYAASKISGEYYSKLFFTCYGLETVSLRFFNVFGPGQGANHYAGVMTRFMQFASRGEPLRVFGDGNQTRDFVNVKDVADGIALALSNGAVKGEVFNICSGIGTEINTLIAIMKEVLGRNLPTAYESEREGEIRHSRGDPTKAEKILGFKPQIGFKEGWTDLIKKSKVCRILDGQ